MKINTKKSKYRITWCGFKGESWDLGEVKRVGPFIIRRSVRVKSNA